MQPQNQIQYNANISVTLGPAVRTASLLTWSVKGAGCYFVLAGSQCQWDELHTKVFGSVQSLLLLSGKKVSKASCPTERTIGHFGESLYRQRNKLQRHHNS